MIYTSSRSSHVILTPINQYLNQIMLMTAIIYYNGSSDANSISEHVINKLHIGRTHCSFGQLMKFILKATVTWINVLYRIFLV